MRKIDEGQFIKLLPEDGMVLTDVATEIMRAEEIDLGKSDSADNYKDIQPTGDLTVDDTLEMLNELGVDTDD